MVPIPSQKTLLDLVEQARPAEATCQLLRVITLEDDAAAAAWRMWIADKAAGGDAAPSPTEDRLLPSVAARLTQLGIASELPAEVVAARRTTFVSNQTRLTAVRPLLQRLFTAMPAMLLKGGARIAAEQAVHLRVVRDIDLLFKPEDLIRALEIAVACGYRSVSGLLPGPVKSRALAPLFAAGERRVGYLEVDFHAVPLRFGRLGYHDADLWQRAVDAKFLDLPAKIPSPSDRFVQAIAHGLVADIDAPADWVVDAVAAMRDATFDPQVVGNEIKRRRLGVPVSVAATLLEELGVAVPSAIVAACQPDLASPLFRRELAATMRSRQSQTLVDRALLIGAELLRSMRRRGSIKSWKTNWMAVPSLRPAQASWAALVDGRAVMPVDGSKGRLTIRFAGVPGSVERPSFDILLAGLWIGRVRFRWTHRLMLRPPPSWRARIAYRFPAGVSMPESAELTVVALDAEKQPSTSPPDGIKIFAEPAPDLARART